MIIIVSNRQWNKELVDYIRKCINTEVMYIEDKNLVTYDNLKRYNPQYIFFPHWSYIIPQEVYESFECIIFHMTDLPFGRGGSPLQNLIARGIYETQVSAIKCCKELDAGDIFLKSPLSLYGTAEEIYIRASKIIQEMIGKIVNEPVLPQKQCGEIVSFKRRKPEESNISGLADLDKIYDYIRMLDAEGYPKAFLDVGEIHFEFSRAARRNGYIEADVRITLKE